ncbi:MAG: hypothetical protein ACE5FD_11520, partial [Anaerolineae bacterium]
MPQIGKSNLRNVDWFYKNSKKKKPAELSAIAHIVPQVGFPRFGGQLGEGQIELFVEDDGRGLDMRGPLNLAKLLAGKHFGLAGIIERAALIGADVGIQSGYFCISPPNPTFQI